MFCIHGGDRVLKRTADGKIDETENKFFWLISTLVRDLFTETAEKISLEEVNTSSVYGFRFSALHVAVIEGLSMVFAK